MNMILHGIEAPNILHTNTLTENLADIQEKDRVEVVMANPPFGGKERKEVQQNFPIRTGETAFLFLQHFIKMLKAGGRGGVVIKNTFLSNTDNASVSLRKLLLESCNLHTVLDCPGGTFLGAGVKTVVLFFEKGAPTRKIWFYQLDPGRNLGKTNPLNDDDLAEFVKLQKTFADSPKSWSVDAKSIDQETFDLSVKNPNGGEEVKHRSPQRIIGRDCRAGRRERGGTGKYQGAAMKNGWHTKPLADVCEIRPPKSEARERVAANALVTFAPMEDLGIDRKFLNASQVKPLASVVGSYTYFADGDVLLAKITPCFENGKLGIAAGLNNGIGFGSSEFIVFRPSPSLDKEFLYYFLARPEFRTEGAARMGGAVGQQRVPKEFIESYRIPVPPLPEQQRIVGILDEAFEGIATAKANAEKNLQNARAIFESHLQSVFTQRGKGWFDSTIGEVIRFIDYRGKTPAKTTSGVRLITAKNVKMGYLQETPMEFIAPASYRGWMTRGIPRKSDVLFTTEAPLANVAQLDTDDKVAFAQRIIIMQPEKTKLDCTFLKYLLLSGPVQQRIRANGTGATVQGIKARLLKLIDISFPKTLAEQEQIVEKLDALDEETQRLESIYQQKLVALEALKKSLLHQAFTGAL